MVDSTPTGQAPPFEHGVDPPVEIGQHMGRRRRADMAGAIGRGRRDRAARRRDQAARLRVGRHAKADAVEAGARQIADARAVGQRQDQRQRPGPEGRGQPFGARIEAPFPTRPGHVRDMGDQRIEARSALGAINAGDRARVGGERAKAVNRLGRKSDQPAGAQNRRRLGDSAGASRQKPGRPLAFLVQTANPV